MTQLDLFVAGLVFQAACDASAACSWSRAVFRAPPIRGDSPALAWVLATRKHSWLRGLSPIPPFRTWARSTP